MIVNNLHLEKYGVYQIRNLINGELYIGSTITNFKSRVATHKSCYTTYYKKRKVTPLLFDAFVKYGFENFKFEPLYVFQTNASKSKKERIIRKLEERTITYLKPSYNVCQKPSQGGVPNLNRKLTDEWKERIRIASSKHKHSKETLEKVTQRNKDNSSKYKIIYANGNVFVGSLIDCSKHSSLSCDRLRDISNGKIKRKHITEVIKLKNQSKTIKLFVDDKELIFKSFSECDKFLNKWRGFTSTLITRGEKTLRGIPYEIITEDIV